MAEDEKFGAENPSGEDRAAKPPESPWTALLKSAGEKALTALLTVGGLAAFAAFAGSVVIWTRFDALQLPPEQIVEAVPKAESTVVGATVLLLFGFCGAIATLAVYLIDRGGRATPGMSRGVVLIVGLEAVVAIWLAGGTNSLDRVIATEVVVLAFGAILWSTVVDGLVELKEDAVPSLFGEEADQDIERSAFRDPDWKDPWKKIKRALEGAAVVGSIVWLIAWLAAGEDPRWGWISGLAAVGVVLAAAICWRWIRFAKSEPRKRKADRLAEETPRKQKKKERRKPRGSEFTALGAMATAFLALAAVLVPAAILGQRWLAITMAAIVLIGLGLWRLAGLTTGRFLWYGFAVLLSVPLFGTVALATRNLDDPQAQPLAIIREGDGPAEALQGLYVTETSDRVYFANVATKRCGKELVAGSGHLFWVPKSEVVAMSVGPQQDVDKAARAALEMANELTPDVETAGGGHVSLHAEGEADGSSVSAKGGEGASTGPRLQSLGSAIRPRFGRGLVLHPEVAAPGREVELRLAAPDGDGFAGLPEGRSLRLNGVKLPIVKRPGSNGEPEEVWTRRRIKFRVPKGATSGIVTLQCTEIAGQPFLTVPKRPKARVTVRMHEGSRKVTFDSSGSRNPAGKDEGLTRRWTVAGLHVGRRTRVTEGLPPRLAPYHVRLDLTDARGASDHVDLRILRLPESRFPFGADRPKDAGPIRRVREALKKALAQEDRRGPAAIEIDGHADEVDTERSNVRLSLRRARWLRRQLFAYSGDGSAAPSSDGALANERSPIPLTIRAFGESCPIVDRPDPQAVNRRVEVFLLDRGAAVVPPKSCRAGRIRRARW